MDSSEMTAQRHGSLFGGRHDRLAEKKFLLRKEPMRMGDGESVCQPNR
jgi:hypothetical protein